MLVESDFLKDSNRDIWTLKRARRDEVGMAIHLIVGRAELDNVLAKTNRLLDRFKSDWPTFATQCAQAILADLREAAADVSLNMVSTTLRITGMLVGHQGKRPLQIGASIACGALTLRFIEIHIDEDGNVLGAQVSSQHDDT